MFSSEQDEIVRSFLRRPGISNARSATWRHPDGRLGTALVLTTIHSLRGRLPSPQAEDLEQIRRECGAILDEGTFLCVSLCNGWG